MKEVVNVKDWHHFKDIFCIIKYSNTKSVGRFRLLISVFTGTTWPQIVTLNKC